MPRIDKTLAEFCCLIWSVIVKICSMKRILEILPSLIWNFNELVVQFSTKKPWDRYICCKHQLVLFHILAHQTKCYTCSSSSDARCMNSQREIECASGERCVTLKYSELVDNGVTSVEDSRVLKFCQHKKFPCNIKCILLSSSGPLQQCKVCLW